jgi:hypothetical protein
MRRVLKPDGRIIVSVPFLFPVHDAPHDYWRFTKYALEYLFRDGWHIVQIRAETDAQRSFAILTQRIAYQSKFYADALVKVVLFMAARILAQLPSFTRRVYGDIRKQHEESGAFASAYFLVAEKKQ